MLRQIAAFLTTFILMIAAVYFLGIAVSAGSTSQFRSEDVIVAGSAALFAFIGGFISGRFGFAPVIAIFYFFLWCLAAYHLIALTGIGFFGVLYINVLNVAALLTACVVGACAGVGVRRFSRLGKKI